MKKIKEENKRKKQPVPSSPEEKKGDYKTGGPGPPSSPSSPQPAPPTSSRGVLLALMHPTLVHPKKASTASVDFPFHKQLPEGALECFHPWAFPMSFHSLLIWGIQALHSVNRWWRVCLFPPPHHQQRSSSVLRILSFRYGPIAAWPDSS